MSETSHLSWSCPSCGRRVPLRVDRCHCGRMRDAPRAEPRAQGQPARPSRTRGRGRQALALWRTLPLDVKVLVVAAALLVTGGLGWALFGQQQSEPLPALLGYMEREPPQPTPRPPARPPFKLPWWR